MILSFQTVLTGQTLQTESDQGLHCLLFHLHLFWCPKIKELYGNLHFPPAPNIL